MVTMKIITEFDAARNLISKGKIIAYPTEAVYGLGCDPFNQHAVETLLALKQRSVEKGLIVLISDWSQLPSLIGVIPENALARVRGTWPGPITWIFPKSPIIPEWVSGIYPSIAIRMTSHPIARELCVAGPLISTSANISGHDPAVDLAGICSQFPFGIDALLSGPLGGLNKPSAIYDVLTGHQLR